MAVRSKEESFSCMCGESYTCFMPTTKPRYTITDTADVAWALDVAQKQWPDVSRKAAITKLLKTAATELENSEFERRRNMALEEIQEFTEVYPSGYLEEIHSEWPE